MGVDLKHSTINRIPHRTLRHLDRREAIVVASASHDLPQISLDGDPARLQSAPDLVALEEHRRTEGAHAITMTLLGVDEERIGEATGHLPNAAEVSDELRQRLAQEKEINVAYAVTHFNPEGKPLGPLTINIGGDCHRTGRDIKNLDSILQRTKDLAAAMLRKSVMIFHDVPALHGGKKGEWIVLDRAGNKLEDLSNDAIVALGSIAIPRGIGFLNRLKEHEARERGICDAFPEHFYVRPDSASPDVLSGAYWRGERKDKAFSLCDIWHTRGVDLSQVTCLPASLGGTLDSSARPTGYGVATTAAELARQYFARHGRRLNELRFLLEAAGAVGMNTVEALVTKLGVPASNITVFDRAQAACDRLRERFSVRTLTSVHRDFYDHRLGELVAAGERFDVWVNNGEGDNTRPDHISRLLAGGVRVFAGGANNFLQVSSQDESLANIFAAGGWAWPDPATSGGGWTLAVADIMARCQGRRANTEATQAAILSIIERRNRRLVIDILDTLPAHPPGEEVWQGVERTIEQRVHQTLAHEYKPQEIFQLADTRNWHLSQELDSPG